MTATTDRGGATVIRPQRGPGRSRRYGRVVVPAVLASVAVGFLYWAAREPVVAINGEWFTAVAFAVVMVATAGIVFLCVRPSAYAPMAFEVDADRIVLRLRGGSARKWHKHNGDHVQVKGGRLLPCLYIGDARVEVTVWQLRKFPVAELRAACLREGWSWREKHAVFEAVASRPVRSAAQSPAYGAKATASLLQRVEPPGESVNVSTWQRYCETVTFEPQDPFEDLLAANRKFQKSFALGGFDGVARAGVAIVTCMDSRIDPLGMIGLKPGDAKILRNPGGRVTDQALVALVLGVNGVNRIMLIQHTRCAMTMADEHTMQKRLTNASGVDASWMSLGTIADQPAAIRDDVARVHAHPLISDDIPVGGFLYDVDTGAIEQVQ